MLSTIFKCMDTQYTQYVRTKGGVGYPYIKWKGFLNQTIICGWFFFPGQGKLDALGLLLRKSYARVSVMRPHPGDKVRNSPDNSWPTADTPAPTSTHHVGVCWCVLVCVGACGCMLVYICHPYRMTSTQKMNWTTFRTLGGGQNSFNSQLWKIADIRSLKCNTEAK